MFDAKYFWPAVAAAATKTNAPNGNAAEKAKEKNEINKN